MKKVELLAPAGDLKSFIGAINAGANAVYLAGKEFGARKYASNFSNEELKEMIHYAHVRNVQVFVTINTIIFDDEIDRLFSYTDLLVTYGVDALIVQDIGLIEELIKRYPNTEIHASTQMNAHSINQLKYLKEIGVSRAILAREVSIDTIKRMKKEVDIDLEVFAHGALCVAYSGNCLFSAFNGGRSGNRGECAQPCRLQYDLYKEDEQIVKDSYIMSTKDLMTIKGIKEIIQAGAMSLKIEGRMKKPEYVVATVRAYREAIDQFYHGDSFDLDQRIYELMSVFNRDYTKGYLLNEQPYNINNNYRPNHLGTKVGKVVSYHKGKTIIKLSNTLREKDGIRIIGNSDTGGKVDKLVVRNKRVKEAKKGDLVTIDLPKKVMNGDTVHITQNRQLEDSLETYLSEDFKLIPLSGEISVYVGKPISFYIKTPFSDYITLESSFIPEKANNPSLSEERLYEQMNKLGGTPYYFEDFFVHTDGVSFVPGSILKELRREILLKLENSYEAEKRIVKVKQEICENKNTNYLSVKVETEAQYNIVKTYDVDQIYIAENMNKLTYLDNEFVYRNRISDTILDTQSVIRDYGDHLINNIADASLNVSNKFALHHLLRRGVSLVTLSEELEISQMKQIVKEYHKEYGYYPNVEVVIYGKPELMVTKYCPITKMTGMNKMNCGLCYKQDYSLRQTNKTFPLIRDYGCNMKIIHHKAIDYRNKMNELTQANIHNLRVNFTNESPEKVASILNKITKKVV